MGTSVVRSRGRSIGSHRPGGGPDDRICSLGPRPAHQFAFRMDDEPLPLLLVHGLFGSLSDASIVGAFDERRILAPDLIGYGGLAGDGVVGLRLEDQADHLAELLDEADVECADVVGHSVGGAVAVLLATRHPDRVARLVSVEGNMTPSDACWSAELAARSLDEIELMVADYRADVAGWIAGAGVTPTPARVRIATAWLDNQPAGTLRAQAAAVIEATGSEEYLADLRAATEDGLELHLVAGGRSRDGWHVPADIENAARSSVALPGLGHLMMLESPAAFAAAITEALDEA